MHVFCDFDGTISLKDTTDEILTRFAAPEWEDIEQQWKRGAIGSAECMQRQIGLIQATKQELDAALDAQEIDPTFPAFVRYCEKLGLSLTVVSDGVDYFIRRILANHRLEHLPVISNHLIFGEGGSYILSAPYASDRCASAAGVCKCRQLEAKPSLRIFVGDGRSDFCASGKADLVFAKHALVEHCVDQRIPYLDYEDFSDVQNGFQRIIAPALSAQAQPSPSFYI